MDLTPALQDAMAAVARVKAERAAKQAEKKSFWDRYNEQLKKHTPHQGGAHSHRSRAFRIWGEGH